jgi:hypothetical protein
MEMERNKTSHFLSYISLSSTKHENYREGIKVTEDRTLKLGMQSIKWVGIEQSRPHLYESAIKVRKYSVYILAYTISVKANHDLKETIHNSVIWIKYSHSLKQTNSSLNWKSKRNLQKPKWSEMKVNWTLTK